MVQCAVAEEVVVEALLQEALQEAVVGQASVHVAHREVEDSVPEEVASVRGEAHQGVEAEAEALAEGDHVMVMQGRMAFWRWHWSA